ncbi:MAG: GntR family transcriptional regulator [Oscillospiraceae bacterium]
MAGTAENSKREGFVREIEAQILSGKLKPGARLEAERELALRFGLSRSA